MFSLNRTLFTMTLLAIITPFCLLGENLNEKLSLSGAIEIGLKNNPEIKFAKENISAVKGRFWSSISLPSPEVGVSYEYTPVNSSLSNFGERTIEFNQSLEFPTNYFLRGSKLSNEEKIALLRLKQVELAITTRIKSAYYNALTKKELFEIAEENLRISEDFFNKAEIRYNVGEGTNLERLTAKVQFTESKNNLEIAENNLRTALAELSFNLGNGKQEEEIINLADSLNYTPIKKYSFEELYNLSVNQQIKISELNVNSSSIDKSLAWSSLLPGFNLSYFKQTRDGDNSFYGVAFGISVPLWFLFENRGQIQEATANVNISESQLQLTKNEVYLKLRNAFNDYENDLRQVNLYINDILPQSEEVYRSALASYDAGEITYIEFLQARQTIISSNSNYINVLFNYYKSIFTLEEIIGQNLINYR